MSSYKPKHAGERGLFPGGKKHTRAERVRRIAFTLPTAKMCETFLKQHLEGGVK